MLSDDTWHVVPALRTGCPRHCPVTPNAKATAVAFGVPFISNPDLPERFRRNAPLTPPDPSTFYAGGEKGYTDEQRVAIGARYVIGIQELLGKRFTPDMRPRDERVVSGLRKIVESLAAR